MMMTVIPQEALVLLAYNKRKALFSFFHHRIVTKVFSAYLSSNANIHAFLCFLKFLFFCFRKFPKSSRVIDCMFKYVSCV